MINTSLRLRPTGHCLRLFFLQARLSTTTTGPLRAPESESPTLAKMRSDLKDAMRAKDSNRLDVLRVFLAAADGAIKAKPSSMRSESQVLALLAKQAKSNKAAAAEFELAKRDDLRKKEEAQLAVLNEYINLLPTVPETEYAEAVTKILANLKANGAKLHYGNVMRDLTGRNGVYSEQPLDMASVSKHVKKRLEGMQ